ncbi:hypothetical protein DRW03_14340 [Corallococcus sp. H22C18031201]|nr:hypothetical protein [Citreicoccus inhibens]RJS22492.1 hypothetical protein DRW03_14340 [Corallococcus sp. H22C18031201]
MRENNQEAQLVVVKHPGPPLVMVGSIFAALFVASLGLSLAIAKGTPFPSPFQLEELSLAYFTANGVAVRTSAFLQFCASVPLGIFTATVVSRLRFLGVNVAGTTIALYGGFLASFWMGASALAQWVLSEPGIAASPAVVRAFHVLAFLTGGPGYAVGIGLLIAGVAVSAGLHGLLSRTLMVMGLVVASLAELSALSLVLPAAAYLLPLARFPAFVWLIRTGSALPKGRAVSSNA